MGERRPQVRLPIREKVINQWASSDPQIGEEETGLAGVGEFYFKAHHGGPLASASKVHFAPTPPMVQPR
jgi:hypothetical protein